MSNSNPLDPTSLIDLAKRLVHPSTTLTSPTQALALLIHSIHSSLSFRLISPTPASTPSDAQGQAGEKQHHPNRLPEGWPQQGGELKFRYKHEQSSLEFVITVVELGDRALIAGAAVDNPRSSSSFDLPLVDYFSRTSLSPTSPLSVAQSLSPTLPFSAPHRLADLVLLYRLNVLQKLIPGLRKEGYSEVDEADLAASGSSSRDPPGVTPRIGGTGGGGGARTGEYLPDRGGPMGMFPPHPAPGRGGGGAPDNDPLRFPGTGGRGGCGGGSPLAEIGRRDLDPLGGMGGTFGGGGLPGGLGGFGGGCLGGLGGGGDGGGMFMGPNHPLFRERFGPGGVGGGVGGGAQGEGRRWGGDGYLPQGGAPPGARFDPVGPVNGPPGGSGLGIGPGQAGFHPGPGGGAQGQGGQGGAGGMRGLGGGGRGVHPDLERPGGNSDYDAMFG